MKRWMLASVLLVSALTIGLVACGDDEEAEKDPPCNTALADTCEGKCGSVVDACGVTQDCGTDCGEGKTCNAATNVCEDAANCAVDKTAACEGKCGTITVKDSCDADVSVECGSECGEGKQCDTAKNECVALESSNAECITSFDCKNTWEYCAYAASNNSGTCQVGSRGTKACGEAIAAGEDATACESGLLDIDDTDDADVCACPCLNNEECGDKYFCDYNIYSTFGWYAECAVGERGTKQCGDKIDESPAECAFGLAIEGENIGEDFCTCHCASDADCPEAISHCSESGGNICIYKIN